MGEAFESRDVDEMCSLLIEKYFEALGLFLPKQKDKSIYQGKKFGGIKILRTRLNWNVENGALIKKAGGSLTRNF